MRQKKRMNSGRIVFSLLAAVCLLIAAAAQAGETMHREVENPAFEMTVSVGYDGMMTYGKTMPVRVRIRNHGGDFEGKLGVNAYVNASEYDRYETEIALPAGAEKEYLLAPVVYARQAVYTAEITDAEGEVLRAVNAEPETTVNPSAMLIGVLSTRPQNMNNLNIDRENDVLARYELWQTVPLTADTFPEDAALLKSFGLLVADDIDPATLNTKQQEALAEWLAGGRAVLCGGGGTAGRNVTYFSGYTGLRLDSLTTSDGVIAGLEQFLGRADSGRKIDATLAVLSGGEPLAKTPDGQGLLYRTAAGAGRIYTAAFELGDPGLNADSLMHYFWQQTLIDQDLELYNRLMYDTAYDASALSVDTSLVRVGIRSAVLPGILIAAGVPVLGCALWWILKRRDKRQWMWLALPVLAAAAAAGLFFLAGGSETNRPMAVISENLVQDSGGGIWDSLNVAAAAPTVGRHRYAMNADRLRVFIYDYVDYDEEEEAKRTEPDTLRTCYTAGGTNAVTAESKEPWGRITLSAEGNRKTEGRIEASVWMEQDGLHGEIENKTGYRLAKGKVITTYGFASVDALEPGEKTEVLLKKTQFADPTNPIFEDGGLYLSNTTGLYSVINSAAGFGNDYSLYNADPDQAGFSAMVSAAAEQLRQGTGGYGYGTYESAIFLYCAKPEDAEPPELTVDGEKVEQQTYTAMLNAEMNYIPVGRTGVVFRSAGMDYPVRMETDENLKPTVEAQTGGTKEYYFALTDIPTFRFTFSGLEDVRIDRLQIVTDSYYTLAAECLALNAETGEWEEIQANRELKDPRRYIDAEGRLYIQFRPGSAEKYAEIPTPLIILEGRQEHAEH